MAHLQITGGSIIRPDACESMIDGAVYRFESPTALKDQLADESWNKGNWASFRRFSRDAQLFTLAAGLALRDAGIDFMPRQVVGLLTADDFEHEADQAAYWMDYVGGGREMGSSSRFVHTLPTSAAADASVTLGLRGPLLYIRDEDNVWGELWNAAADFVTGGDADLLLLSCRRKDAMTCLVVAPAGGVSPLHWPDQTDPQTVFSFARQVAERRKT